MLPRPLGLAGAAAMLLGLAACGASTTESAGLATDPTAAVAPSTAVTSTVTTTTTSSTTSTTTPTTTSTTTTSSTTSSTTTSTTLDPLPDPGLPWTNAAFDRLAATNPAVSMTVVRDGVPVLRRASGTTIDGTAATPDSPMVVASLSKLLTGVAVARLAEVGLIDTGAPVPWTTIGVTPDPAWRDVTVRELLDHTSGMPVARRTWFDGSATCDQTLRELVAFPPAEHRGKWTYSNGNYCALGLLVEEVTGRSLVTALEGLLLAPLERSGIWLSNDGAPPDAVPYALGLARLSRLGGAGGLLVSTDDLAAVVASLTPDDRITLAWPGVMTDQYGWGHTGTVDGAKACAWTLERGRTVIVTTVAGGRPSTGGGVCDQTVQAIATDLGVFAGEPERSPV